MTRDTQQIDSHGKRCSPSYWWASVAQPASHHSFRLDAAGGFAMPAPQTKGADAVTVRRPLADRKVDVFRFSLSEIPAKWEAFPLATAT
jgi:hypothetical protein